MTNKELVHKYYDGMRTSADQDDFMNSSVYIIDAVGNRIPVRGAEVSQLVDIGSMYIFIGGKINDVERN